MLTEFVKIILDRKEEVYDFILSRMGFSFMINYEMYDRFYEKLV